jgi:competence protein ComEC
MKTCLFAWLFLLATFPLHAAGTLNVYCIDVEGGQATLIVSPSGQSLLVDAGWPGFNDRDADRIVATARAAGVKQIDFMLVTHYHLDHVGGVPPLAAKIPIVTYIDHGPSVETGKDADELFAVYRAARDKARHLVVKPGDKIPIKGLDIKVVSAAGKTIPKPLPGAGEANPFCANTKLREPDPSENAQSIGILINYGKFRLIDLADLTWNKEYELACPVNRVGKVDVYVVTHHGMNLSGSPAMVQMMAPRVAVMDNGARKGGSPEAWQTMHTSPGLEDIWQLHYAMEAGQQNNAPEPFIANPEENCRGFGLTLSASADGAFTVTNARNGYSKKYSVNRP